MTRGVTRSTRAGAAQAVVLPRQFCRHVRVGPRRHRAHARHAAPPPLRRAPYHWSHVRATPPTCTAARTCARVTRLAAEDLLRLASFRALTRPTRGRLRDQGLTYAVPSNNKKGEEALLLDDVSGFFMPGAMSALVRSWCPPGLWRAQPPAPQLTTARISRLRAQMGPSGSGKTTLLDVLAGRKTAGTTRGTLLFGGVKPSRQFLRRFAGYVEQFDTLLRTHLLLCGVDCSLL